MSVTTIAELSVREAGRSAGGSVVPVHITPLSATLAGRGDALLLIHGYNNSLSAAANSFKSFVTNLETTIGRGSLSWPVFGVQWPGDEPNGILSTLSYPLKIKVAKETAVALFNELSDAFGPGGTPIFLRIVTHSLGARVILELLKLMAAAPRRPNVIVDQVVLMAAAVPTEHAELDGDLHIGITTARGANVLYSRGDHVLQRFFPLGQTFGGDGFFPTAIGRNGGPVGTWTSRYAMSRSAKPYDHGDYWSGSESAAVAASIIWPGTVAPPIVNTIESRPLAEPSTIEPRAIPARPAFA